MAIDVASAEKKLRQAEFFLSYLQAEPLEIAKQLAKRPGDHGETLEYYFSACLGAAQSAFYIVDAKGAGKQLVHNWKMGLLDQDARSRFNAMIRQRGSDVHYGKVDAEALPAFVAGRPHDYDIYNQHNRALLGDPAIAEHTNPDGTRVRAPVLRGTVDLYLDRGGTRVKAATACREFIDQLRSLVDDVKERLAAAGSSVARAFWEREAGSHDE